MLSTLWQPFVRPEDGPAEVRQKSVVVPLLMLGVFSCFVHFVANRLVYKRDLQDAKWLALELMNFVGMVGHLCALSHLKFKGLTMSWKILVPTLAFIYISTVGIVLGPSHPVHFGYVLVLDLCLFISSKKDAALMHRLALVLLACAVVYVSVHILALSGYGPNAYPYEFEYNVYFQFVIISYPLVLNYFMVRRYAVGAFRETARVNDSVEVATKVAELLVNFDLDGAELLLKEGDSASPINQPLSKLVSNLRSYRPFLPNSLFVLDEEESPNASPRKIAPNEVLVDSMSSQNTSWDHARAAVAQLRDPEYTLKQFDQDMRRAFPELQLYGVGAAGGNRHRVTLTSGRSSTEEYQRTLGALYSVYCFSRVDMDGKDLFSYGVGEGWEPLAKPNNNEGRRLHFHESMPWQEVTELFMRAGLLQRDDATQKLVLNSDRMMAMLVLTAVHDVMKNPAILPTVQRRHEPYHGIEAGEVISDHDVALAYVMENYPSLLPSFYGLEPGQRAPILFTQGKMGFNNGWLVQGEAPPGALLSTFKKVVQHGRASEADIAFYFVHWLTDLAGAEPFHDRPWPGAEKFVLKFPLKVLDSFLESFAFLDRLAYKSEVEVMEEYLESTWASIELEPPLKAVAKECRLAAMRIALMAQGFEAQAVLALTLLSNVAKQTLCEELARTGHKQQFRNAPKPVSVRPAGPALLVYYGPALVQKAGPAQVHDALVVLAATFRAARELFPLEENLPATSKTAVVRIDALKVLMPRDIIAARVWHLVQTSATEAEVVRGPPPVQADGTPSGRRTAALELVRVRDVSPTCMPPMLMLGAPLFSDTDR